MGLPLAGVQDQDARFALERLEAQTAQKSDLWLNARDYGMVGDNSTDNLAALNKAIAALNHNGGALYIPPGVYSLTDVPDPITTTDWLIFGAGPATSLRFKSTAAHGTFFTLGTHATACSRGIIRDLNVQCNAATNVPPATERAFHLVNGGTCFIENIGCINIGGLCKIGTTDTADRFQLYGFENIRGNWNSVTAAPSRIHIINGTDGRFVNLRLTENEVNGGYGIHADPTSVGVDQHFFDNCEVWSMGAYSENLAAGDTYDGIDRNVYINFTNGQVVNWVFKQCVFDESRLQGVYIFSGSGNNTCRDMHFVDCHWATNAGRGVQVNHNGTGTCQNIEVIGGRIRYKDQPAVQVFGGDVDSFYVGGGISLQHESFSFFSTTAASDQISTDATGAGGVKFKHGLAVNDELVLTASTVTTSPANMMDAGDTVFVKTVVDAYTFTVSDTSGGAVINITNNGTGSLMHRVGSAFQQDDANGVRVTGCYFGPFENVTNTDYAVKNLAGSTSDHLAITGNVAVDMNTGFDNGYTPSATQVVANNAT